MMIKKTAAFLFISLVGLAIYSNSFDVPFQYDDIPRIVEEKTVHIESLGFTEMSPFFSKARPVANLSFALNYLSGGLDVFGYHLVNISIHLLAAFGLFLFTSLTLTILNRRSEQLPRGAGSQTIMFDDNRIFITSLLAALLWLANPIQIQAVTYIVQRMASMAAMLYIFSVYFYALARISTGNKRISLFTLSLLAAILAYGCKQNSISLPIIIIAYELTILRRFDIVLPRGTKFWTWLTVVTALVFFLVVSVLWVYIEPYLRIYTGVGDVFIERLFTEARVFFLYLSLFFFPISTRLNIEHDITFSLTLFNPPSTFFSILGLLILAVYALASFKKRPLHSFLIFWIICTIAPESMYIPISPMYEHRAYLPFMGLAIALSGSTFQLIGLKKFRTTLALLALISVFYSLNTYRRNNVWKDEISLWSDAVKKSPYSAVANVGLGISFIRADRLSDAINPLEKAKRADPMNPYIRYHLGLVLYNSKMYDRATSEFRNVWRRGVDSPPGQPGIDLLFYNMALYFLEMDDRAKGEALLREALRYHPENEKIRALLRELGSDVF